MTATFPLTPNQRELWLVQSASPHAHAYNILVPARVRTDLDLSRLRSAAAAVGRRHDMLRAAVAVGGDGTPHWRIAADAPPEIEVDDGAHSDDDAVDWLRRCARRPFDLGTAPLWSLHLCRAAGAGWYLLIRMHHIAGDLVSFEVMLRDLLAMYGGEPVAPVAATTFARFVADQAGAGVTAASESFWRAQLTGSPEPVQIGAAGSGGRPSYEGDTHRIRIADGVALARRAAAAHGTSVFRVLLAAYQALLHRFAGCRDFVVGVPASARTEQTRDVVGHFVNMLPLRCRVEPERAVADLIRQTDASVRAALEHQQHPTAAMAQLAGNAGRRLYQTTLNLVKSHQLPGLGPLLLGGTGVDVAGISLEPIEVAQQAGSDEVALWLSEAGADLVGWFAYRRELADPGAIARMADALPRILAAMEADPSRPVGRLPLLPRSERHRIIDEWNATAVVDGDPGATIPSLFADQAERTPDAPALLGSAGTMTFRQLDRLAESIAAELEQRGVRPGARVGIHLHRSPRSVAAMLGAMKLGAAYVPLDPAYPEARLLSIAGDAGVGAILTDGGWPEGASPGAAIIAAGSIEAKTSGRARRGPDADAIVYLLYTSGSTGRPKGVMGHHRGAVNRLRWAWESDPFQPDEVGCHKTSPNFVDSVAELFSTLCAGLPCLVVSEAELRDPALLVRALADHRVSRLVLVPSHLDALLAAFPDLDRRLPHLRHWTTSGEALSPQLARRFHDQLPGRRLINLYGSTEVAADATVHPVAPGDASIPIGRPLRNTRAYVLDAELEPLPVGSAGELYVGGVQLAHGYWNQPAMTAERFVPDPFDPRGGRLYRTGDRARLRPDGAIEYLGRTDHQVKLRGVRIELGEIEVALREQTGGADCVVVLRDDGSEARLVGYVVGATDPTLRDRLASRLPSALVPAAILALNAMPRTPNGKIDRAALPAPAAPTPARSAAPSTPLEHKLAAIWCQVLRLDSVGVDQSFVALGGNSLSAMQLASRIRATLGIDIELSRLFDSPTIADLARELEESASA